MSSATARLTVEQRARIAAEDGAASLARVLRRAELAGHDPRQTLVDAVGEAPLAGAKNTTNVLYSRISDGGNRRFDPVGSTHVDWVPRTDSPEWNDYLSALAAAADQRAAALGRAAVDDPPEWAVAALGPVPDDLIERNAWRERAGVVAAYRELRGHDDQADALGPAPKAGQVEQYAAYRAAWRALGRPEVDRAIDEKSDGQLRMWVRGWQREQAWGPRYVGHELAGTRQAAAHQQQTAALRHAEADASTDPLERSRLQRQATEAAALADALDRRAEQLQELDDVRSVWLAHTAATRANAEEAEAVLAERHANDAEPEPVITAEEWLAAHRTAVIENERHRPITEDDLADEAEPDQLDQTARVGEPPDIREVAAAEPRERQEDVVRVPTAEEVEGPIRRAQRSLAEIHTRDAYEQEAEIDERTAELARWNDNDRAAEREAVDEPALERSDVP